MVIALPIIISQLVSEAKHHGFILARLESSRHGYFKNRKYDAIRNVYFWPLLLN